MNKIFNIKNVIPPFIYNFLKKLFPPKYGWFGNYADWEEAQANSSGYGTDLIIKKVKNAAMMAKNGEVAFERDSITFTDFEIHYPLMTILLLVSLRNSGKLHVVDFGGSLGSTYFQHLNILNEIPNLKWDIIEQYDFVKKPR